VSGPVAPADCEVDAPPDRSDQGVVELTDSRTARVGALPVRRALPRRSRRTVGAWCFVDHMGPASLTEEEGVDIGPHPHIGLQTVTWLFQGRVLHRDSLGSEQVIAPGQLNLMTAGEGVSHSEERTGRYRGPLHGMQLWVAQPSGTRHGAPAFEHHASLPQLAVGGGTATVLVGELDGTASPARADTEHVGVELDLPAGARATLPLRSAFEYAVVVGAGAVHLAGQVIQPGRLAYLGTGRDELALSAAEACRLLVIGGTPFEEPLVMWWNFVARTHEEVDEAHQAWAAAEGRFGTVASPLARIEVGPPPWSAAP
jgi:redox-sensitive bicupin YhaK (pirin superfamily)